MLIPPRFFQIATAFALTVFSQAALSAPQVVVSIKPVHSLVAGVMNGVAEPRLIIDGTASPHRYRLKPSQAQALESADIVFWIGAQLETFLQKPIKQLASGAKTVSLIELSTIEKLEVRESNHAEHEPKDEHDHKHKHGHGHEHGSVDPHIWLNPENAILMVDAIAATLIAADPDNRKSYAKNAAILNEKLKALTDETAIQISGVKGRPFLVFHDSYQYFEERFGLKFLGAILNNPDVPSSAKQISEVREKLRLQKQPVCIFTEPQFNESIATAIASAGKTTIAKLDPIGANIAAGPDHYIDTMTELREALVRCLKSAD